jgi:hypothetical protein
MRPPFGSFTPTVINTLKSLGFIIAMWTQDSGDSLGVPLAQQKNNYNGLGTIDAGATIPYNNGNQFIFLNHDVQVRQILPPRRSVLGYQQLVCVFPFPSVFFSAGANCQPASRVGYRLGATERPPLCREYSIMCCICAIRCT